MKLHIRDQIVRRLLEHAFGAKHGALKAEESALFARAMRDVYGGDVLDRIAALPREWFATTGYLWTSANGMRVALRSEEVAVPRCGAEDDAIRDAALAAERCSTG